MAIVETEQGIFMEAEDFEEYKKQKEQELKEQLAQVRIENPEKIADTTMYELNQNIISQMKDLTNTEIKKRMKLIRSWLYHRTSKYYALICWDYHYITIFNFPNDNYDDQVKSIQDILINLGPIKAMDPHGAGKALELHWIENHISEIDAFEIWVTFKEEDGPRMFMLFPYDGGVVTV